MAVLGACAAAIASAAIASGCTQNPHASLPLRHGYDPRERAQGCLRSKHVDSVPAGARELLIGSGRGAPSITFTTTFAEAQTLEIRGQAEGAERIGSALLYVRGASDTLLKRLESCLARQDSSTHRNA